MNEEVQGPMEGGRGTLTFLGVACAVGVASIYFNQPLLLVMGKSFGVGSHAMGFVATATQVGYAIGLLTLVPLGDVRERRGLMMRLYAAVSGALLLAGFVRGLSGMILASLLIGLFSAVTHIVLPIAPDLVPKERRGQAVGTVMTGLLLGILLARTFAGWLSGLGGWRTVFFVAAVINMAFVPIMARIMPKMEPKQSLSYADTLRSLVTIFRREPLLREAGAMGALSFASFSCFWTTMAFMLHDHYGLGPGVAGSFGIVGAAGAMIAPVAGKMADKHGTRYVVSVAGGVLTAAIAMLWVAVHLPGKMWVPVTVLVVAVLVLDSGQQMLQVGNQTRIFSLGSAERSRVNTVYMTMYFVGGAVGSALSTAAWSRWGWTGVCGLQMIFIALAGLRHATGWSRNHTVSTAHLTPEDREFAEM